MKGNDRNLLPLWDYGWMDCGEIVIPRCDSYKTAISAYIASDDFGTSFVGPDRDHSPDLHGPFRRSAIRVEDFVLLTPEQFAGNLAALRQPDGFSVAASDAQWQSVKSVADQVLRQSSWILKLCLTEKNIGVFHDWGFVLGHVFREFIFGSPEHDRLTRIVISLD